MRNLLITGTGRGLGEKLKSYLLEKGYHIYGTSRKPEEIKEEENYKVFYLDLCNQNSINDLVDYFEKSGEYLDGIIHNAGIAYLDPIEVLDQHEYREIFEVNFFGPVDLTSKLLPFLKKAHKSNIIFISSIVSIDCWPYLGAYSASKRAIESVAFEWSILLKQWNIHVSIVQPNPLPTDMQIKRSKNARNSPYPELINRELQWESIDKTLELIYQILSAKNPKFQYQTGKFSRQTAAKFLNEEAIETSLEKHQKHLINLLKTCQYP